MSFYNDFDDCLSNVIDSIKFLLFDRNNEIFERLDFDKDDIYLEPLLFTFVNQNDNKWLDSIIYGYEKKRKQEIDVFTNSTGVIYIPQVGYFKTNKFNTAMKLKTNADSIVLVLNNDIVNYEFEKLLILDSGIEILKYQHPLLENLFTNQNIKTNEYEINGIYQKFIDYINNGLEIINKSNPNHYNILKKTLKRILLFKGEQPNSFAVMTAHNMIFLNVNDWDSEMFFVDHISHEGGHITFFTLTYESKNEMFNCNFNTNFNEITGNSLEHGTIYLRFHALFSYMQITQSLYWSILNIAAERELIEAKGRFIFHMKNFNRALSTFRNSTYYKPIGLYWYNIFIEHYNKLEKTYLNIKNEYLIDEQPYDFNWEIFKKQNHL